MKSLRYLVSAMLICIIQPLDSSLRIHWLRRCLLRSRGVWATKILYDCSQCVRKILNARPIAAQQIKYLVGPNSSFLLWHDSWCRGSPIQQQFHESILSNAESFLMAKVSSFMQNDTFPPSNHVELIELRHHFTNT